MKAWKYTTFHIEEGCLDESPLELTMNTMKITSLQPEVGIRASRSAPIIVGTDSQEQSDAALAMARVLCDSADGVRLLTVVGAMPMLPDVPGSVNADIEASKRAEAKRNVDVQVGRVWHDDSDVEVYSGDPAHVLSKVAHTSDATIIIVGIGKHRVADRLFGSETALRLVRVADRPVLAVADTANGAPRRTVVAMDFSETSQRAARLALELSAPGGTIYLAHVAPRDASSYGWGGADGSYKQDAGGALERVREQLYVPGGMTVQKVILQGDPATELLAFATSVNADLIATGSHGRGFVTRMLIGSVATRLMRLSTCSVLSVPPSAVMTRARLSVEPPHVAALPHPTWAAEMDAFSRRNAGRRGTLEIDDPEIGAQAELFDFPLVGAAFDRHDETAELMFGSPSDNRRHLTHSIGGVTSIDILRDDRGRDMALRIAHGAGQTLLTFTA